MYIRYKYTILKVQIFCKREMFVDVISITGVDHILKQTNHMVGAFFGSF